MRYDFDEVLAYSKTAKRSETDIATLLDMIPDAEEAWATSPTEDRLGVDYKVRLSGGRELSVDVKTRQPGCSKYWRHGEPEVALEIWSVTNHSRDPDQRVVGWTYDPTKETDLILYIYPPGDSEMCYLVPFTHLRKAFGEYGRVWIDEFGRTTQTTPRNGYTYDSQAVFVPASKVLMAVADVSVGATKRRAG